jgi:methionyl-tRNA formyltransferase
MKIIFFGSSEYCIPILDNLYHNFQLIAVVTKQSSAAQQFAELHSISVLTPKNKAELLSLKGEIKQFQPDLAVVADYGLIIPPEIFTLPKYQTLNIHFSRLPALRGPSPVQFTILTGKHCAWISIIIMAKEMDTGDIIWQKEIPLEGNEISERLYKKLFQTTAQELPNIVNLYTQGKLKVQKQDHAKATYTKLLTRDDGFIPPKLLDDALKGVPSSDKLERTIRAFTPWPGAWTNVQITDNKKQITKRLKLLKAHLEGNGLILDMVQLEGKKPVSWKQFQAGYPNSRF